MTHKTHYPARLAVQSGLKTPGSMVSGLYFGRIMRGSLNALDLANNHGAQRVKVQGHGQQAMGHGAQGIGQQVIGAQGSAALASGQGVVRKSQGRRPGLSESAGKYDLAYRNVFFALELVGDQRAGPALLDGLMGGSAGFRFADYGKFVPGIGEKQAKERAIFAKMKLDTFKAVNAPLRPS